MNDVTQMNIMSFAGQIITGLVMLVGLIVVAIKARGRARVLGALGLGLGLVRVVYGALQPLLIGGGGPDGFLDRLYIFNFVGTLLSLVSLALMVAGIASHERETKPAAPPWPHPGPAVPGGPQPVQQQVAGAWPLPQQPGASMPQQPPAPQGMPQRGEVGAFPQGPQQVPAPQPSGPQPPAPRP